MKLWAENDVRTMFKEAGFSDTAVRYARGLMMPRMMIACGTKR